MHAGDGDAVLQAHQLGKHLVALNHGNVNVSGSEDLGIIFTDGGAGNYDFRPGDMLGFVALVNGGAELGQAIRNGAAAQIGAGAFESEVQQHLGDAAHADAAEPYKLDAWS